MSQLLNSQPTHLQIMLTRISADGYSAQPHIKTLTVRKQLLSTHLPWLYPLQPDGGLKLWPRTPSSCTRHMLPSPATLSSICSSSIEGHSVVAQHGTA